MCRGHQCIYMFLVSDNYVVDSIYNVVYLVIGYNITILFASNNYVINNDITNDTSFIVVLSDTK